MTYWHRPIVLRDARPEHPNHYDREQSEERLKETTINLSIGTVADVRADNVLEDLPDGKQKSGAQEIDLSKLVKFDG